MASHTDIIRKFDTIIQSMRAGGVNNPIDYIEQISYFLFLKLLDEREQQAEQIAKLTSKTYDGVFAGDNEKYRFRNWAHSLNGDELRLFIESDIFPFIRNLKSLRPEEREYFRNAHLKIYEPSTLKGVVENIASMDFSSLDTIDKGDLYEHMLSQISKSGKNGQFRTPRHIIDMMTSIVDPDIMETVYDPSVGTAGFIISAFQHILKKYSDPATMKHKTDDRGVDYTLGTGDKLTETQSSFLYQKTFYGYDIDAHMVRFSIMNMILHGFTEGTNIRIKDTLGKNTDEQDKARQYDIILANPPFSGTIDRSRIDSDDFPVASNSTEVLFLGHMIDKLRDGGRAAVIVPEGVLFKTNNDYQAIRKYLMNKCTLQAVISLPSGVFNPYSGVKTNILVFQKGGKTEKVWFYDMHTDGYDLGAQRRPSKETDIPDILHRWKQIKQGEQPENDRSWCTTKEEIEKNEWVLSAGRYKTKNIQRSNSFSYVKIEDVCEVIAGQSPKSEFYNNEGEGIPFYQGKTNFGEKYLQEPTTWTSVTTKESIKGDILMSVRAPVGPINTNPYEKICIGRGLAAIRIKNDSINIDYLWYMLKQSEQDFAEKGNGGAVFNSINKKQIEEHEIPLPPLDVQQELVNKLNAQQAIIDSIDTLITQLEEAGIDESLFDGIDEWVELGNIDYFKIIGGGTPSKSEEKYWIGGQIPWVTVRDFSQGYQIHTTTEKINQEGLNNSATNLVPKDTVLVVTRVGLGKFGITVSDTCFNQDIKAIQILNNKFSPQFLMYFLITQKQKIIDAGSGATVQGITLEFLKKMRVPCVDMQKQKTIVNYINNQLNAISAIFTLKEQKQTEIRKSLDVIFS